MIPERAAAPKPACWRPVSRPCDACGAQETLALVSAITGRPLRYRCRRCGHVEEHFIREDGFGAEPRLPFGDGFGPPWQPR